MSTTSKRMRHYTNYVQTMKKNKLVVLLENCLQDVPRRDKSYGCSISQGLSSNITTNELLEVDSNSDHQNNDASVSDLVMPNSVKEESADCSNQTGPASAPQTAKPLFLNLPITSTTANNDMATSSIIDDNSTLYWSRITEPLKCEVKTPLISGNSSGVDLDLTPPSSIASGRSLIEDNGSTSLEELDNNIDNKILTDKDKCKELCVKLVSMEPTMKQLQNLYIRNDHHKMQLLSSRPKRDRKQFIPFMFQQAEYVKKKKPRSASLLHSTPKLMDTSCVHEKKQIKIDRKRKKAIKMKQLRLALREKEAFEKQQLRLALKQKKEALKWRNKFENALASINRRICTQNTFWKMLPS